MTEEKKEIELAEKTKKDEQVEKVEDDINIPETLEKYRENINKLEKEYKILIKDLVDGFDGSEIFVLINENRNLLK